MRRERERERERERRVDYRGQIFIFLVELSCEQRAAD